MKKTMVVLLMALLLSGCAEHFTGNGENTDSAEKEQKESYSELYRSILDEFYAVTNGKQDSMLGGTLGVTEAIIGLDSEDALNSVGYALMDISGDGVPELVIGSVSDPSETAIGTVIYAVYTVADGKSEFVLEGRTRSSYRPMKDGGLFYQGSSGAMYSIFGTYDIAENGSKLICRDYYFTFEKNTEKTEIGFFHNKTGEWNTLVSNELPISSDEFWDIEAELIKNVCRWELEPFAAYTAQ